MTRWTALVIRGNDDFKDGAGIEATASGPHDNGQWAGWVALWREGHPHIAPLLSTAPIYPSKDAATDAMRALIADIRQADVTTRTMP